MAAPANADPSVRPGHSVRVVTDFPGGSAKVESLDVVPSSGADPARVTLRILPAGDRARGWVCWWYLKVEGLPAGAEVILDVGGGVWATPDRASLSTDDKVWTHTAPGKRTVKDRITYTVRAPAAAKGGDGTATLWLAWGPPFTGSHAHAIIDAAAKTPHAKKFELAKTRDGRPVPAARVTHAEGKSDDRFGVWVQARQHAWETGGSWVAAGFLEWITGDDPAADALRRKAVIVVVPIMDLDNVERGCGGKDAKPQDHNRDWSDAPHWPEVAAAQRAILAMDAARGFDVFLDLHNPAAGDRVPFFFTAPKEGRPERSVRNQDDFLRLAKETITGPLAYKGTVRESGAGYDKNWKLISKNWVTARTSPHVVSMTLETAWNSPDSTAENYRRVGRELAATVGKYLGDWIRVVK